MMGYDADPDDERHYGSGDELGTFCGLTIKDDGAIDYDVKIIFDDGDASIKPLAAIRDRMGDEAFKQFLEDLTLEGHPDVDSSDFEMREPVAFKCTECNETFPRTMNDGHDRCPGCSQ